MKDDRLKRNRQSTERSHVGNKLNVNRAKMVENAYFQRKTPRYVSPTVQSAHTIRLWKGNRGRQETKDQCNDRESNLYRVPANKPKLFPLTGRFKKPSNALLIIFMVFRMTLNWATT